MNRPNLKCDFVREKRERTSGSGDIREVIMVVCEDVDVGVG